MNDWDWLDATGTFHSDAMTMVERFAFVDAKTMSYEVTITDPKVLTRPFTIRLPFEKRARAANYGHSFWPPPANLPNRSIR